MSGPTIAEKFRSLFTGFEESFVKHVPPFALDDSGKLMARFVGIAKYKTNSSLHPSPPGGYADDDNVPLEFEQYKHHLEGKNGLALSPLTDTTVSDGKGTRTLKNACYFAVLDFDVYGADFVQLIQRMYKFGYKFGAFASKSGGLHIYFFFQRAEGAKEARAELARIVEIFGLNKLYTDGKGKSKVEIFPQHDARTPGGPHDKCVFLPFYGGATTQQKMITIEGKLRGIEKALPFIETQFTSVEEIKETTDALPYSEAPFCIQMLLISGAMGQGSGRNEFLFTCAVYLKTRDGDSMKRSDLDEMNELQEAPLTHDEVSSIFSSAKGHDYQLFGRCDKAPVCDVCDKQLCKLRKYGVGKQKGNVVSNVEFGSIVRVRAETPYYLWEARLAGTEEFKILRIDGAENLLNQKVVQRACIDTLGQLSVTVTVPVWERTINTCLATLRDVDPPKQTDTTELAELHELFNRFLTHRKMKNNAPYTVNIKQIYYEDGVYYFKTDGFTDFLRTRQFKLGRTNLREELMRYGCKEGNIDYTTASGVQKVIECWQKVEDADLKKLDTFYEDIMSEDAEQLHQNKLNKEDRGNPDVDDQRF